MAHVFCLAGCSPPPPTPHPRLWNSRWAKALSGGNKGIIIIYNLLVGMRSPVYAQIGGLNYPMPGDLKTDVLVFNQGATRQSIDHWPSGDKVASTSLTSEEKITSYVITEVLGWNREIRKAIITASPGYRPLPFLQTAFLCPGLGVEWRQIFFFFFFILIFFIARTYRIAFNMEFFFTFLIFIRPPLPW